MFESWDFFTELDLYPLSFNETQLPKKEKQIKNWVDQGDIAHTTVN